jgi:ubiquinone/menaquinone biosynthesis C-methylase UbiE
MSVAIERRYSVLAESSASLSCGSAVQRADVQPGQVCIDLGCGRGTDVLRLADLVGPTGQALGLDLTEAMLEKGRARATQLGLGNATFRRSTLEHLEAPTESADWVFSNCVLNHATDKSAVWRELARVLKPGGHFIVSDIYAAEAIAARYRDDPEAVAECWAGAVTRTEYLAQIAAAGLTGVKVLEESEPYDKGPARVVSFTVTGLRPRAAGHGSPARATD